MAFKINQNINVFSANGRHLLHIIHGFDADDIAPVFSSAKVKAQKLFWRVAKQGNFKPGRSWAVEHASKQPHGGMITHKIAGEIANADFLTPRWGWLRRKACI